MVVLWNELGFWEPGKKISDMVSETARLKFEYLNNII